ncbi:MAG: hypothetical protein P4L84_07745 [Isosphaeraceae bacterium]|nr:hypothetical protein [Isosphaeraceae bacterium]
MLALLRHADSLLRTRPRPVVGSLRALVGTAVLFGLFYGGVMGTFGGIGGARVWQLIYSAVKVPLLLVVTFGLSLPSFFVLNTLVGLRADFAAALRALAATQAGLTVILASFAPFTLLWYASSADYPAAILFNALMFGAASLSAQILLRRGYRPLIERDGRHRWLLRTWLLIYAFVGVQMGWLLRPFIGAPDQPVQFFRSGSWENAYVIVARMIWNAL